MTPILVVSAAIVAVFVVYALLAPAVLGLPSFMRPLLLPCPHHVATGRIRLNGILAALTNAYGRPRFRVMRCNLLRPGETCDEGCMEGARPNA